MSEQPDIRYRHTQRGDLILIMLALAVLLVLLALGLIWSTGLPETSWPFVLTTLAVLAVVIGAAWYFSSMTVEVAQNELRWRFALGRSYKIALSEIESVAVVPHSWLHGYGIRWIGPKRWAYIVSGREAVEVHLKSGGWRRLGTDDAQGLSAALTAAKG